MKTNAKAICVEAYRAFIIKAVEHFGGFVEETKLDQLIEEKFRSFWSRTDKQPWGDQSHSKWKQNVASAKSALDRCGVVVRYVARVQIGKTKRFKKVVYRAKLPPPIFLAAWDQWSYRKKPKRKRRYRKLLQPEAVFVVPEVE